MNSPLIEGFASAFKTAPAPRRKPQPRKPRPATPLSVISGEVGIHFKTLGKYRREGAPVTDIPALKQWIAAREATLAAFRKGPMP